jgi:serine/threonine-protein kinase
VGEAQNADMRHRFGRYRLYDVIAAGGMATVHYGRLHGELGFARTVAIKRLHPEYTRDPEFVAMFMDEARLTMRVQHPNVVQTLDVVAAEGELLLVMEYVPAVSLWHLLGAARRLGERVPPPVAAAVVGDALRGLHAAHEATDEAGNPLDIVHRDVSPQNILVGTDGIARMLDFGVAKASGRQQVTREGQVKGKFAYMAPEQITNVCVTRQSDVFAASIVLWEALTGTRLFQADSETALLARVLSAPIEPPSAVAAGLDPQLDRIVLRGLSRDLAARYATAREMARDLEDHAGVPSTSQVAEWVERLAGDDLARRAARVAEIENESRSERVSVTTVLAVARGEAEGHPAPEGARGGGGENREQANDRAESGPRSGARAGSRRWIGWIGAAALTVAAAAGVMASSRPTGLRAGEPPGRSSPALPATAAPASAGSAAPEVPAPSDSVVASPAGSAAMDPGNAAAAATPNAATNRARSGSAPAGRAGSAAPGDGRRCDPPYYVDSGGHLIYKPECFR